MRVEVNAMYTFIVVDDEHLIRKGLLKKLEASEHKLTLLGEADNGADALELIESSSPDIVFTDMRMPEMDGQWLIRTVSQRFPHIKLIVISGHTDFDYMQEAISAKVVNYLLKPFSRDEVQRALQQAILTLEQERSLKQEVVQLTVETEQMKIDADQQTFLHVVLSPHLPAKRPVFRSREFAVLLEAELLLFMMIYSPKPCIVEHLPSFPQSLYIPHPQSEQLVFLMMYNQAGTVTELQKHAVLYTERILAETTTTECCIGISLPLSNVSRIRDAHHQSILALDQRSITDFGKCYTYTEENSTLSSLRWNRSHELLFSIESGSVSKVQELIADFFAFFLQQPDALLAHLKEQCRDIVAETKRLLQHYLQSGSSGNGNASSSLEAVLDISFDMESIRQYMDKVLTGTALLLQEYNPYRSDQVIDNVRKYIDIHYAKNLTLEWVSSLFYLNPSYLSYLFKEKHGENFTDYVNRLRIEQAKRALTLTEDKVYRIAKQLGYDNPKYFFRVFKKVTGLTPEEFRKQYKVRTTPNSNDLR
ncbi:response regulator [Paenibacillus amylolyticus]|uniref:Response regulator n=3 Tax=Paenibacillus TaxID=44249 RepID=A0A5M9WKN5_PAEAM|nr:response regulator [Paenibacillus amylolyticus]